MKNIVPAEAKRPVGRPRTGKISVIISIDPAIKKQLDVLAQENNLNRSAYVETLIELIGRIKSFNDLSSLKAFLKFL